MTSQLFDSQALSNRLETLERQNRNLRAFVVIASLSVTAALLMAQAHPPTRVVEAEEFVVREAGGRPNLVLRSDRGVGSVVLFDSSGKSRAFLTAGKGGNVTLRFVDKDGIERGSLGGDIDGSVRLVMYGERGDLRALYTSSALTYGDSAGMRVALFGTDASFLGKTVTPSLRFQDPDGRLRLLTGMYSSDTPAVVLWNRQGTVAFQAH